MTDNKVFSVIFNERRDKSVSRHQQHQLRPSKKKDPEYEIIVPPSMRKNQAFMAINPPIHRREPEFPQSSAGTNKRSLSLKSKSAIPGKVDPELRDEASLSSLDKDIIQPSSRPHFSRNISQITPSNRCLVLSRTLQSRLPIPRQNAIPGLLSPTAYDQRSHSYNNKSRNSFYEMQREIKQIVMETKPSSPDRVHILKKESRDDIQEAPAPDTANTESTEQEQQEDPVTKIEPTCTWWRCW